MRLTLARLSATEVQVLWTFHHVLLDGWSVFQVLGDVFAQLAGDGGPPTRRPFRDYVESMHWLTPMPAPLSPRSIRGTGSRCARPVRDAIGL